jgi:uncharacterized damage-inducible protein DinB
MSYWFRSGTHRKAFYYIFMKPIRSLMRTYVEYTHWENLTILAACTACPHASLEANVGASHGSLLDTLRHTYLSDAAWRNRVLSGAMPPLIEMAKPEQYSGSSLSFSIADLKEHWPQVTLSLMEWLESVSDSELDEMLVCRLEDYILDTRYKTLYSFFVVFFLVVGAGLSFSFLMCSTTSG